MILFINACVRSDSRTERLAEFLLSKRNEPVTEVLLKDISFPKTDEAFLAERDRLIAAGDFSNPVFSLAVQFSQAERIVIIRFFRKKCTADGKYMVPLAGTEQDEALPGPA